jgi:anti-sigma regulatory factor (Ser/Thr protein kinase)
MPDAFQHEALPYKGRDEFVSTCAALVHDAYELEQRIILLAAAEKLTDVRDALGARPLDVSFVPTDEHGRNPSRITTLLDAFQAAGDGRRCLGLTEPASAERPTAELTEARLADCVLNLEPVRSWPMSLVCMYDTAELDDAGLSDMRRSHPSIRGEGDNDDYDPDLAHRLFATPLPARPPGVETSDIGAARLGEMRRFVRTRADDATLAADRVDDFVLAANEVVTNSLRHGGGRCQIAVWHDGTTVTCEIRDAGRITDPLTGRLAPPPAAATGRGLWLVNHLCDFVQIRSSQAGTVVRLVVDR